jgi:hypothetical protein
VYSVRDPIDTGDGLASRVLTAPLRIRPTGLHSTKDAPPEANDSISAWPGKFGSPCGDSGPHLGNHTVVSR